MLFNSSEFVVFFLVFFSLYWSLNFRFQNLLLLVASLLFYGWWGLNEPHLQGFERVLPLVLLVISTLATHYCAKSLALYPKKSPRRRGLFWLGVSINVGMLGYFKYRGFFLESVQSLLSLVHWQVTPLERDFLLPAGISFYTFQGLSYLVNVYGGVQKPTQRLQDFALFHVYFPQLVAGPIERARNLFPLLFNPRTLTPENLASGVQLIIIGYVKKVAIADAIAPMTSIAFDPKESHTGLGQLLGIYLFALQIYGDFSGYSDIARGVSRLLGVDLMINFRQPYFSRNITEFWDRWHISLSSWLRDYVFMPLSLEFRGKRLYLCLFLTMLISGLWHGASWNFVIWGALHGLALIVHRWWAGPTAGRMPQLPRTLRDWVSHLGFAALTFHFVAFNLVLVKTRSLADAWSYMLDLFEGGAVATDAMALIYLIFYGGIILLMDLPCWWNNQERPLSDKASPWLHGLTYGLALLLLAFLGEMKGTTFVYFQF